MKKALAHPIYQIDEDMRHPLYSKVASFACSALKDSRAAMLKMRDEASAKSASTEAVLQPLSYSSTQCNDKVKAALQNSAVVRQMLAAATGH